MRRGGAGAEVLAPLVAGMTATRASLLAWVHAQGVVALREVFATEAAVLAPHARWRRQAVASAPGAASV